MSDDGTKLPPHIHPFPDAETVFAGNVAQHRRHFLPLLSIDASAVNSDWSGRLHVVAPKEVCDGAVGEHCGEFHTELCADNQMAFSVGSSGQYQFLADFKFFLVERGPKEGYASESFVEEFGEFYEAAETSYEKTKGNFLAKGVLNSNSTRQPDRRDAWLLKGEFYGDHPPVLFKGRALTFVARVQGHSYFNGGPDSVSLYFDPVDRIAVIRCDFS